MKVVIVTTFARAGFLRRALDAGVSGYLLKDAPAEDLAEALRKVHRGGRAIDPQLAMDAWSDADPLNDRERQVLRLAGEGLSATDIAGKLNLSSRSEVEIRKILEQKARERAVDEWTNQAEVNAEIRAFIADVTTTPYVQVEDGYDERDDEAPVTYPFKAKFPAIQGGTVAFLSDLNHKLNRYGNLTENQVAAVVKIKARNDERLAAYAARNEELAEVAPLAEGRYEITGTIVSTKIVEGYDPRDQILKMLVEQADGNRVFGTVPGFLADAVIFGEYNEETKEYDKADLKGKTITFKATVERSRDDEHFGFFKRPTGATLVEEVAS